MIELLRNRLFPVTGEGEGGGGRGAFQTDLPIYPSLVEMTAYKFYILWKWTPPECCGNNEYSSYKSCRRSPHSLSRAVFLRLVYYFYGCFIQFQFVLITALYYFHWIYENNPPCNAPLSENDPPKPIKILKVTPQQNAPLLLPKVMNDQPPAVSGKDTKIKARIIVLSHEPLMGVDWKEGLFTG